MADTPARLNLSEAQKKKLKDKFSAQGIDWATLFALIEQLLANLFPKNDTSKAAALIQGCDPCDPCDCCTANLVLAAQIMQNCANCLKPPTA